MIDHIGIEVSDYERSKEFYAAALKPLDYAQLKEHGNHAGFGTGGKPDFWVTGSGNTTSPGVHVAFRAENRALVDAFYEAAIAAGGRDNGGPGVRDVYHPNYYGAFVLDPDGHNIEAVCHTPE